MKPFCAAIDWGTSRFRLWILGSAGEVIHETSSDEGLLTSSKVGFENVLETHLEHFQCPKDLPVIICGMAGSRSGWCEAQYIDTPANLLNIAERSVQVPHPSRDIRILPGIAQRSADKPDVIRGEETQLFGMLAKDPETQNTNDKLVCMPGTHSKWVLLQGINLKAFTTFMSGELFAVIAQHSILKMALDISQTVNANDPAFLNSLHKTIASPAEITAQFFQMRSSQLLGYSEPLSAKAALSGTIIGMEMAGGLKTYGNIKNIDLMATGNLHSLYKAAFQSIGIEVKSHDAESAGRDGLFHAAQTLWREEALGRQTNLNIRKA